MHSFSNIAFKCLHASAKKHDDLKLAIKTYLASFWIKITTVQQYILFQKKRVQLPKIGDSQRSIMTVKPVTSVKMKISMQRNSSVTQLLNAQVVNLYKKWKPASLYVNITEKSQMTLEMYFDLN